MSHKREKIASIIHSLEGSQFDPHYLGFFECFNQQLFFEAHEVLEELWLGQRNTAKGLFYKGLIQLAGAFVHIQKRRRQPAIALFQLARDNLGRFPTTYESLDLGKLQGHIISWIKSLQSDDQLCLTFESCGWPKLSIEPAQS